MHRHLANGQRRPRELGLVASNVDVAREAEPTAAGGRPPAIRDHGETEAVTRRSIGSPALVIPQGVGPVREVVCPVLIDRSVDTARLLRLRSWHLCVPAVAPGASSDVGPGAMSPSVKIGQWLRVLYPPDPGETAGSAPCNVPPRRAAHLRELRASPDLAQGVPDRLDARQALQAVTLLARVSADDPHAEELLRQALPGTADLITGMQAPAETPITIFNAIPDRRRRSSPGSAAICRTRR